MTEETYTVEMNRRERTVLVMGLGALLSMIQRGMVKDLQSEAIALPTLAEIRDITNALWPGGDPADLRDRPDPQ